MKGRVEHLLFEAYRPTAEGLAWYRIFYASMILLFFLPRFSWAAELPEPFFDPPPGPLELLPGIPPRPALVALELVVVAALVAILVGWRTVASSWVFAVAAVIGSGITYSFGKVDHGLVLAIIPPLLAHAGWGRARSLDRRAGRAGPLRGWPVALYAWLLALMMFSAAWPKLTTSWLSPSFQAAQEVLLRQYYVHDRTQLLAGPALRFDNRAAWEVVDWSTVLLEVVFIVAWLSPRWMRVACTAAALFHLSVLLTVNIAFIANVVAYGAFFALLVRERDDAPSPRWLPLLALGLAVAALASRMTTLPPGIWLADQVTDEPSELVGLVLIGSASVGALYLVAREWRERRILSRVT